MLMQLHFLVLEPVEVHHDVNDNNNELESGVNNGTNKDKATTSGHKSRQVDKPTQEVFLLHKVKFK
eukprot:1985924-Ditylum_brightwellii.AAC.1